VERTPSTLNALLEEGEIDALISPFAPDLLRGGDARVGRLWPDYRERELDYFRRTGIFPIMHLLVVRRRLLEAHPALAGALAAGFGKALDLALQDLGRRDYPKIASSWLTSDREATVHTLGCEPWTYGVDANGAALDTLLRYAEADGMVSSPLPPSALFAPFATPQLAPEFAA
jgi:4,5-dihydroxyphthalate decarboxylase